MSCVVMPLDASLIREFADQYIRYSSPKEVDAENAIEAMVPTVRSVGYLTYDQFLLVCAWKSPRIKHHAAANDPEHLEEATRIALQTPVEELRTGALMTLSGVSYPVASVFLHWFHKDPYPILDFRALESLGIAIPTLYTHRFWQGLVLEWREKLRSVDGCDARAFDRALWRWSKTHSTGQ